MKEFDITFPIKRAGFNPRKWEILKSSTEESIVIGIRKGHGFVVATVYPYKRKKTRLGRWIWFKWLKVRIFFGIIKTN